MDADSWTVLVDHFYPRLGPCRICGPPVDGRHARMDAMAELVEAGEELATVAAEFDVPAAAVVVAAEYVRVYGPGDRHGGP